MDPELIQRMRHRNRFTDGRWDALPLCGKMGNIGSEVGRACYCRDKGDEQYWVWSFWTSR